MTFWYYCYYDCRQCLPLSFTQVRFFSSFHRSFGVHVTPQYVCRFDFVHNFSKYFQINQYEKARNTQLFSPLFKWIKRKTQFKDVVISSIYCAISERMNTHDDVLTYRFRINRIALYALHILKYCMLAPNIAIVCEIQSVFVCCL